jgi:Firmicute plasmid replication protein (RepL).
MAKTINLSQFDRDTGEEVSGFVAFVQPKRKSSFQRHFTMNQDALKILAKELNGEQTKVLLIMLGDLEYENYILIPQKQIAETLGMLKANVSRSVKALINIGVVQEGPRMGSAKSYRLNPEFGWKGTIPNHKKALKNGLSVIDGGRA